NGAPFAVNGNQIIVVDPTGFAAAQTWLDGFTTSILNAVNGPANGAGVNGLTAGFSLQGDGTQITPVAAVDAAGTGQRIWGSTFGGVRGQDGSGPTVDLTHLYGGLLFGVEGIQSGDFRAGAFVGGGSSRMEVNFNAQEIEVWSAFGGLYARKDWASHWIKAIVTGGWAGHESKRRVANNRVAGGIETAVGKYDGYFIAPAVTVGGRLAEMTPDHPVLGSVRVHYAGLFLDGYSETNVTTPLT
ncbi:MAG: autotransporter outer membrane beta-barrel domain-containing protein, partial [bacterium]|nr:autotransporter outer membrane beta-barrel domain-containing protein [bacterium]